MKKCILLLSFLMLISIVTILTKKRPEADVLPTHIKAQAMLLVDFETGEVLYEKNSKQPLPIAGLTQMMTQYIVLNRIDGFKLDWDHTYIPSPSILSQSKKTSTTNLKMKSGEIYTVEELFKAMSIASANDAAVALAEMVARKENDFVKLMNDQAAMLGLKETEYFNASGFEGNDDPSEQVNLSSARDVALLARKLLLEHPAMLHYANMRAFQLESGDVWLNTNLMLKGMPYEKRGMDGLKTGYTVEAGPCFVGTGTFNGRRIVSVVLGVEVVDSDRENPRFELTEALIDRFTF